MTSEKPSILIVTGIYPPEIGGPATYSKLLADELPKRGYQVQILPFRVVKHLPKIIRHIVFIWKIIQAGKKVDIIYAQDPVSVGLPTRLACFFLGRSYLLRLGGDYAWEQGVSRFGVKDPLDIFVTQNIYGWSVWLFKKIQTHVARNAERVIVPSEYLKRIVIQWGVPASLITVIYSAFEAPNLSDTQEDLRSIYNLSHPTIVSVGRLVPWKGFRVLIECMSEIKSLFPGAKLLIIGEGPEYHNLQQKIIELNLEDSVLLLGSLPKNRLFGLIKASDVFVLNTSYEGLSHQLLEVLSLGVPVVTTNVGGNLELIRHMISGVLVTPDDKVALVEALSQILTDPSLRQSLVAGGYQELEKFSAETALDILVKILL